MSVEFYENKIDDGVYGYSMHDGDTIYANGVSIQNGPFKYLCDFEVNPAYRGIGYGKKFMDYMVNTVGINCLDVDVDNFIALNLYDDFGFQGNDVLNEYKVINGKPRIEKVYFKSTVDMDDEEKASIYRKAQSIIKKRCGYTFLNDYLVDDPDVLCCIASAEKYSNA